MTERLDPRFAGARCSACVVCKSPLVLIVVRPPRPGRLVHCNTCGSEVPEWVHDNLRLAKARGRLARKMSTQNAPHEPPR